MILSGNPGFLVQYEASGSDLVSYAFSEWDWFWENFSY